MNFTNQTLTTTEDVHFLTGFNVVIKPIFYILAILGNSATIVAICSCRQMRNLSNAIIVSLAASDFLVGLNGFLIWIVIHVIPGVYDLIPGVYLNMLWPLLQGVFYTVSALHLLALGLERSIALFLPLRFNEIVTKTFMKKLLVMTWLLGFLVIVNILWMFLGEDERKVQHDYWIYRTVTAYTIYCVVVTSLMTISVKTLLVVKKKIQIRPDLGLQQSKKLGISKATKRCTAILAAYVVAYTPVSVASLLMIYSNDHGNRTVLIFPLLENITLSNSFINVIVYCVSSKKYRHAYVRLLRNTKKLICGMCFKDQ